LAKKKAKKDTPYATPQKLATTYPTLSVHTSKSNEKDPKSSSPLFHKI
jgi:hypothetical protein